MNDVSEIIWRDIVNELLMFVGAAAEFPLDPENYWLFYTGNLPTNPLKRMIDTLQYHRVLLNLKTEQEKVAYLEKIRKIHDKLEVKVTLEQHHPMHIPNEAFKRVNDQNLCYAMKGYEYLHRVKMSDEEKEIFFQHFKFAASAMHITDLSSNYQEWYKYRKTYLQSDLYQVSDNTHKLFAAYRKDISAVGYWILRQFMAHFAEEEVVAKLGLKKNLFFTLLYYLYPYFHNRTLAIFILHFLLPKKIFRNLMSLKAGVEEDRCPV